MDGPRLSSEVSAATFRHPPEATSKTFAKGITMSIESLTLELIRKEQECDGLRLTLEAQHDRFLDLIRRFSELPAGIWVIDHKAEISGPFANRIQAADKVAEIAKDGERAIIITAEEPLADEREAAA